MQGLHSLYNNWLLAPRISITALNRSFCSMFCLWFQFWHKSFEVRQDPGLGPQSILVLVSAIWVVPGSLLTERRAGGQQAQQLVSALLSGVVYSWHSDLTEYVQVQVCGLSPHTCTSKRYQVADALTIGRCRINLANSSSSILL
jgi:hypothetical protein